MKIIFMGTPDFSVKSLLALIAAGHEIIGVFTNPDKPKGRGNKLSPPPVKVTAMENDIPVFQPKTMKSDESYEHVLSLAPDCIVVVAYGKILPQRILGIPKCGCVNVHGSLLPSYRGAAPIQWSVLNGDRVTGITTMLMNDGIDTGDILLVRKTEIHENETSSELFIRLADIGAALLCETLEKLEAGELTPIKQDSMDEEVSFAPMLTKEMALIDFSQNAKEVHKKICGLSEQPCAFTFLEGKRLKLYHSEVVSFDESLLFNSHFHSHSHSHSHSEVSLLPAENKFSVGSIIKNEDFLVICGENTVIKLTEVQYEGSKRMSGRDFLLGRRISDGAVLSAFSPFSAETN